MRPGIVVELTAAERDRLEAIVADRNSPQKHVWRAGIVLAAAVEHINRIKGLLFAQGISDYEPLLRKTRERFEKLRTGDGGPLPEHLKAQIGRELDRLELTLQQIKSVETERDAMLSPSEVGAPGPRAMLDNLKGIGPDFAGVLWSERLFRSSSNRLQVAAYAAWVPGFSDFYTKPVDMPRLPTVSHHETKSLGLTNVG